MPVRTKEVAPEATRCKFMVRHPNDHPAGGGRWRCRFPDGHLVAGIRHDVILEDPSDRARGHRVEVNPNG